MQVCRRHPLQVVPGRNGLRIPTGIEVNGAVIDDIGKVEGSDVLKQDRCVLFGQERYLLLA